MRVGRFVTGSLATVTVVGCAVLAVGMSRAGAGQSAPANRAASTPRATQSTSIPAQLPTSAHALAPAATSRPPAAPSTTPAQSAVAASRLPAPANTHPVTSAAPTSTPSSRASSHPAARVVTHASAPPPTPPTTAPPTPAPAAKSAPIQPATAKRGTALPLRYSTGSATRVITVVARSTHSTTATLQAWKKAPGGGWLKSGRAVGAHVGSDGLSRSPSEYKSATPIGSFTLTQAFGRYADPGTALPYLHTTPADWWISQPGKLYNTHQRCASRCSFTRGDPNEHLYYETPYYNYAVVIDYNTRNTGHVRQGAGSAFFLHVSVGQPTAGCVSIPQSRLVSIMRWLTPSAHPRILIGVS